MKQINGVIRAYSGIDVIKCTNKFYQYATNDTEEAKTVEVPKGTCKIDGKIIFENNKTNESILAKVVRIMNDEDNKIERIFFLVEMYGNLNFKFVRGQSKSLINQTDIINSVVNNKEHESDPIDAQLNLIFRAYPEFYELYVSNMIVRNTVKTYMRTDSTIEQLLIHIIQLLASYSKKLEQSCQKAYKNQETIHVVKGV